MAVSGSQDFWSGGFFKMHFSSHLRFDPQSWDRLALPPSMLLNETWEEIYYLAQILNLERWSAGSGGGGQNSPSNSMKLICYGNVKFWNLKFKYPNISCFLN